MEKSRKSDQQSKATKTGQTVKQNNPTAVTKKSSGSKDSGKTTKGQKK